MVGEGGGRRRTRGQVEGEVVGGVAGSGGRGAQGEGKGGITPPCGDTMAGETSTVGT